MVDLDGPNLSDASIARYWDRCMEIDKYWDRKLPYPLQSNFYAKSSDISPIGIPLNGLQNHKIVAQDKPSTIL
jgi:hypothetical protein